MTLFIVNVLSRHFEITRGEKSRAFSDYKLTNTWQKYTQCWGKIDKRKKNSLVKCNGKSGKMEENCFEITRKLFFCLRIEKKNFYGENKPGKANELF